MDGEDLIYRLGLNLLSTKERLRARMNTLFLGRQLMLLHNEIDPTDADREQYKIEHPAESAQLEKMYDQATWTNRGTVAGTLAGTAFTLRFSRIVPVVGIGVYLSAVASYLVSDDIAGWATGTYKFDNGGATAHYYRWIRDTQRPTQADAPQLAG